LDQVLIIVACFCLFSVNSMHITPLCTSSFVIFCFVKLFFPYLFSLFFFFTNSLDNDFVPVFARKRHFRSILQEKSFQAPTARYALCFTTQSCSKRVQYVYQVAIHCIFLFKFLTYVGKSANHDAEKNMLSKLKTVSSILMLTFFTQLFVFSAMGKTKIEPHLQYTHPTHISDINFTPSMLNQ